MLHQAVFAIVHCHRSLIGKAKRVVLLISIHRGAAGPPGGGPTPPHLERGLQDPDSKHNRTMTCSRQSLGTTILMYAKLQGGCCGLHRDVTLRPATDVEEDDAIDGLMEAQADYHPAASLAPGRRARGRYQGRRTPRPASSDRAGSPPDPCPARGSAATGPCPPPPRPAVQLHPCE